MSLRVELEGAERAVRGAGGVVAGGARGAEERE